MISHPEKIAEACKQKDFNAFAEHTLQIFQSLEYEQTQIDVDIEFLLKIFFEYIVKPDTVVPPRYIHKFLDLNPILANLTALSSLKNTDALVQQLAQGENNFIKFLALYNARNHFALDTTALFEADAAIASIWYSNYFRSAFTCASKLVYENIHRHCRNISEKFKAVSPLTLCPYFASSYLEGNLDIRLKHTVNQAIKKTLQNIRVKNHPDPKKIAVISQRWVAGSAVYRTIQPILKAWAQKYDLTLILIGENLGAPDTSIFKNVKKIDDTGEIETLAPLLKNDFQAIFYPDIGMNYTSMILSNLRLAPVQIAGLGHPVSTFGSEINYFLSGANLEITAKAQENYSERLVLLPDIGVQAPFPSLSRNLEPPDASPVCHIALPWGVTKIIFPTLDALCRACEQIRRPVKFHFFPGSMTKYTVYRQTLANDLTETFGRERVELHGDLNVTEYFEQLRRCEFAVDAYPFGGCNSIMDALWLSRPVITWTSERLPGRFGRAFYKTLNLDELIAADRESFIQKIVHLANDFSYTKNLSQKIVAMDLEKSFKSKEPSQSYLPALETMIEHISDSSREPIIIE